MSKNILLKITFTIWLTQCYLVTYVFSQQVWYVLHLHGLVFTAQLLLLLGRLGRLLFKMKTEALNRSTVSSNREMKERGREVSIKALLWVFFKALTEVWSATFHGKRDRKDRKWCNTVLKWTRWLPLIVYYSVKHWSLSSIMIITISRMDQDQNVYIPCWYLTVFLNCFSSILELHFFK